MNSLNIEQLIALVRKTPQLWDRKNKYHSNRNVMDKCWRSIAKELQADEHRVRRKWKYLRDQFSVEFGKIPPAGCEEDVLSYEPRWRYYKPLQFLEDVVTPRVNSKNPKRDEDSSESQESSAPSSPLIDNVVKTLRYSQRTEDATNELRYLREKKKRTIDSVTEEHLHFFKSLLPHVRSIPPHLQLSFRNRVQEVVEEFAYRPEVATTIDKPSLPPHEPYFITCVPEHAAKFEPPESVDDSHDNQEDDDSS